MVNPSTVRQSKAPLIENLERWSAAQTLMPAEAGHVSELLRAIRDQKLEGRLGRKIGAFIEAVRLAERPVV